jgi:hypothetical protein
MQARWNLADALWVSQLKHDDLASSCTTKPKNLGSIRYRPAQDARAHGDFGVLEELTTTHNTNFITASSCATNSSSSRMKSKCFVNLH